MVYEQETLDLSKYGIDDGMIGILDIPKMDVTLPLYIGATQGEDGERCGHAWTDFISGAGYRQ